MISSAPMMLIIFGITMFITSGSALNCYSCTSEHDNWCNDMNTSEHTRRFFGAPTFCENSDSFQNRRSICRKIVRRVNNERRITRKCDTPRADEMDIYDGPCSPSLNTGYHSQGYDTTESCHICSTDGCNSATNVSIKQWLFASALMFFIYTFYQSKYAYTL